MNLQKYCGFVFCMFLLRKEAEKLLFFDIPSAIKSRNVHLGPKESPFGFFFGEIENFSKQNS